MYHSLERTTAQKHEESAQAFCRDLSNLVNRKSGLTKIVKLGLIITNIAILKVRVKVRQFQFMSLPPLFPPLGTRRLHRCLLHLLMMVSAAS